MIRLNCFGSPANTCLHWTYIAKKTPPSAPHRSLSPSIANVVKQSNSYPDTLVYKLHFKTEKHIIIHTLLTYRRAKIVMYYI